MGGRQARGIQKGRLVRLRPTTPLRSAAAREVAQLKAIAVRCEEIYDALAAAGWPGASKLQGVGIRRGYKAIYLRVEEILCLGIRVTREWRRRCRSRWSAEGTACGFALEAGLTRLSGPPGSRSHSTIGRVEFIKIPLPQLTPELVTRAAARYCVERGVSLNLR